MPKRASPLHRIAKQSIALSGIAHSSIGIDLESISRIGNLVSRYDRDTLEMIFTPLEIDQCQASSNPNQSYTLCFCIKEAVGKALGTGLADIGWNEIETMMNAAGHPPGNPSGHASELTIQLSGAAHQHALQNGVAQWQATWCSWDDYVLVHVFTEERAAIS